MESGDREIVDTSDMRWDLCCLLDFDHRIHPASSRERVYWYEGKPYSSMDQVPEFVPHDVEKP